MSEFAPVLAIEGLHKAFGALVATDGVTLDVRQGEIHALIGPNGAGKSTLIAQICGEQRPDRGTIRFDGRDVTALPAYRRARLGLGRSFQLTQLCPDFSVVENVLLSLEAGDGGSFDLLSNPRKNAASQEIAARWIDAVGLSDRSKAPASALSHGEKRQLEIAVAMARQPRLLLLDEPMAGMGPDESAKLTTLLLGLKAQSAILLVEHDMDAVFKLADRISVLVYGRIIFTGTVAEVRGSPAVQAAYLGSEAC